MATNSMVFLREYILERPERIDLAPVGDLPLMLLLAKKGKIGYIDDVMSVYRIMSSQTSWSATIQNNEEKQKNHYFAILKMWINFDEAQKTFYKVIKEKKIAFINFVRMNGL